MTVEDHSSNHLNRAKRREVYKTDYGKVVLFVTSTIPRLRPFKGVLLQYLQQMDLSVRAEGKNAITRYKAYMHQLKLVIGTGKLPSRKFRHAMPLFKIALDNLDKPSVIGGLFTIFRSYDLYMPPQSQVDKELRDFELNYMVDDIKERNNLYFIQLEDSKFDFEEQVRNVISDPDFKSFIKDLKLNGFYSPQEQAIMLSKHGTSRFNSGKPIKGFAPSIIGATAELRKAHQTLLSSGESYYDLLTNLGSMIGDFSRPSMTFKKKDIPPIGKMSASLRRTVAFGNPGFKTRVIGIGDYYTQYVLSPLHDWAFAFLRKLSSDYTFNQGKGFEVLSRSIMNGEYVACYDLSNATDALPINFSETVLRNLFPNGHNIAPLWKRVMTELPSDNHKWYRVGQPMGLLSSWSIGLALSHHMIIWIAANQIGILSDILKYPRAYYGLDGDDLFIIHPVLAHYYLIIMGILGVKINLTKSLISHQDFGVGEFVKRNTYRGDEISAISPKVIVKSYSDYICARELILKLRSLLFLNNKEESLSFDEESLVDLYRLHGTGFTRSAINVMQTVPEIYSGLSKDRLQTPPQVRIKFLVEKALNSLEYALKVFFISNTGKDTLNELTSWSIEDDVPNSYLPQTSFYEFLRKWNLSISTFLNGTDIRQNALMAELAIKAFEITSFNDDNFDEWEINFLSRLAEYSKPLAFVTKEASRIQDRTLAFKVFKHAKVTNHDSNKINLITRIDKRLINLLKKFSFQAATYSSKEDMYAHLFSDLSDS